MENVDFGHWAYTPFILDVEVSKDCHQSFKEELFRYFEEDTWETNWTVGLYFSQIFAGFA